MTTVHLGERSVDLMATNLANPASWSTYGGTVSTNNSVSSITLSPPTGNQFYRLFHQQNQFQHSHET
jgi:hypothetical protein